MTINGHSTRTVNSLKSCWGDCDANNDFTRFMVYCGMLARTNWFTTRKKNIQNTHYLVVVVVFTVIYATPE